jgi:hypothetical protein
MGVEEKRREWISGVDEESIMDREREREEVRRRLRTSKIARIITPGLKEKGGQTSVSLKISH